MLYRTADLSVNKLLTLSGSELSSPRWTKSQCAAFAAMVLHGEPELMDVTQGQLCRLSRSSAPTSNAHSLSPGVRTSPHDSESPAGTSEQLEWRPGHP